MFGVSRKQVYLLLEVSRHGSGSWGRWVDRGLITLICLNVVVVILESVAGIEEAFKPEFLAFEIFSVAVFTTEYVLRVWCCVEHPAYGPHGPLWGRLRFMVTPMAIVDLLAFAPLYIHFIFPLDLRFMRVVRLLRIFKLTRYSPAMSMMIAALRREASAVGAGLFILGMLIIVASSLIHIVEHQVQPEAFGSIPESMWWAVITLTTVGYGDVHPITPLGKLIGGVVAILGVGMVALPAGLLASSFAAEMRARRERYKDLVDTALEDGSISKEESGFLHLAREKLGLSEEDAHEILKHAYKLRHHPMTCPHCGKDLDAPPEDVAPG